MSLGKPWLWVSQESPAREVEVGYYEVLPWTVLSCKPRSNFPAASFKAARLRTCAWSRHCSANLQRSTLVVSLTLELPPGIWSEGSAPRQKASTLTVCHILSQEGDHLGRQFSDYINGSQTPGSVSGKAGDHRSSEAALTRRALCSFTWVYFTQCWAFRVDTLAESSRSKPQARAHTALENRAVAADRSPRMWVSAWEACLFSWGGNATKSLDLENSDWKIQCKSQIHWWIK